MNNAYCFSRHQTLTMGIVVTTWAWVHFGVVLAGMGVGVGWGAAAWDYCKRGMCAPRMTNLYCPFTWVYSYIPIVSGIFHQHNHTSTTHRNTSVRYRILFSTPRTLSPSHTHFSHTRSLTYPFLTHTHICRIACWIPLISWNPLTFISLPHTW